MLLLWLFTNCKFHIFCTCFTFHVATPMKFAFTSFFYFCLQSVITPSAAHHLTTVRALWIQLTDSALCSLIDETRKLICVFVSYYDFYLIECLKKHAVKSYQESQWSHFDDNNRVISLRKPIHLRLVFSSPSFLPWDVHVLLFSREWQHHIFPPDDLLNNEIYKIKICINAYQLELIWWN